MSKVVLITGASKGIGAATAILAATRGWSVAVNYNSNEGAANEVVKIISENGGTAIALGGNVASEHDVAEIFDKCEKTLGPISGLVNNAGILHQTSLFKDIDITRWREVFETNVIGCFLCAREAVRRMSEVNSERNLSIVNLTSMAAVLGGANEFVDYAASKGAIDAMTVGLAKEYASQGIRVNAVRPGLIETDMHDQSGDNNRINRLLDTVPLGRSGTSEEVAEAIIWLLSDAASYVTGSTITVSGGR